MAGSFFDTNVLVYAASSTEIKARKAESLLRDGGFISVQVLNELTNVARRKMLLTWPETRTLISLMRGLLTVHPLRVDAHERALILAERYDVPIYDALIAASALIAGCETLWSEDFQHGMILDGRLTILNPFLVT